jgi:NAD(P)-dependent dehydrogenase (short-subunit alcohol dehydrogenase family)
MKLLGKTAVITGGAGGIGTGLAKVFSTNGASNIVIADLDGDRVSLVAKELGVVGFQCDVTREDDIKNLVSFVEDRCGPIDVFVSNAGVFRLGGEETSDDDWQLNWNIHVMAHVYAARAVAPVMAKRGSGYLVNTSSAAGLLMHIKSATYSVTKHGAVAFAEYLAATYGPSGVKVSVLCPQAVRTAMTAGDYQSVASIDGMLEPEELAACVVTAMDREEFLILPHPEVLGYMRRKTGDYDRWLRGMARLKGEFDS